MLRRYSFPLIALLAMTSSGCGQTGALYLPDRGSGSVPATPEQSDAESAETESEERENKRATDDAPATDTHTPVTPPDPARPTSPPQEGPGNP